jgi:hypothetical protein
MPSKTPREPEVEVTEDNEAGFIASIYDGEYLIQVRPHENGYQLSLASKEGMGDAAFLRTYGREERFRRMLDTEFDAIDEEAVFEVLEEHFADEEYRIVNLKKSIQHFAGRGADLYVETGETVPTLTDEREYRDDQWVKEDTYRLRIWPTDDLWIEVQDPDSGDLIADYRPNSLLEDIRNEEKDEHERERGPTSVPGVHGPVTSSTLDDAPVVHTHIDCAHLVQLTDVRFNPAGEKPPKVFAEGFGELPLRWCSTCMHREPTTDQIEAQYGS